MAYITNESYIKLITKNVHSTTYPSTFKGCMIGQNVAIGFYSWLLCKGLALDFYDSLIPLLIRLYCY